MVDVDVAVIGAGPYGLSVAAHLAAEAREFRIFGFPMRTWREHMPEGMLLKSDGFASSLSAPGEGYPLRAYCREHGLPYDDLALPVPLSTFNAYALAFQRRFVPAVEQKTLTTLARTQDGFRLGFDDGERTTARRVVLAIGIMPFSHVPPEIEALPPERRSHSSAHRSFDRFRGTDVAVIGAGSSAVDVAVAMHEAGARTRLTARAEQIRFSSAPTGKPPSLWRRVRHPRSGLGPGLRSRAYSDFPDLFRLFPIGLRHQIVGKHLGPSSPWLMKQRLVGHVELETGRTIRRAGLDGDRLFLDLAGRDGGVRRVQADHIVAATGYRIDLARLGFLSDDLRASARAVDGKPELTAGFETSAPGLFIVGNAAAGSFGPLMRFMYGAEFAARRVVRRLRLRG